MVEFSDLKGHAWRIQFTYGDVRRIRTQVGVDLVKWYDSRIGVVSIADDDEKLLRLLWLCVDRQAAEDGISEDEFLDRLDHTIVYQAFEAIQDAMVFFFREDTREAFVKLRKKMKAADGKILEALKEELDSSRTEQVIEEATDLMLKDLRTSMQPSSSSQGPSE